MIPIEVTDGKKIPSEDSDCYKILEVLSSDNQVHIQELFDKCAPGARNWACRSRVSNLRKMGYNIINLRDRRQNTGNIAISREIDVKYGSTDNQSVYTLITPQNEDLAQETIPESHIPACFEQNGQKSLF